MIGKTLAHYEITSQIGKGGMGEVYQAKDTKLGRDVAIKVLPEEFAKDADRVARFQREAKLLASLNHPNIAAIYGLEESTGIHFLVMELVDGQTLDERIKSGPIPVEEALKLAHQIAEALEAAHEKGVIHRDLKPANIKVTPDGKVKVLDFGLAKAFAGEQDQIDISHSPTLSDMATQQGVILGTAAYMPPEQAKGKPVDKRADVWAFGVVLFEMLTGRRLFTGETGSEILAAVIKSEPDWDSLPPNLHPRIRLMLERCLEKDPKKRYSGINDAWVDIEKVLADPSGVFVEQVTKKETQMSMRAILPWVAMVVVAAVIITWIAAWYLKPSEPFGFKRFNYNLPEDQQFNPLPRFGMVSLAISPFGDQFVYSTNKGLFLRSLDNSDPFLIPGTDEYSLYPFYSPDGKYIGFWSQADHKLKKMALSGWQEKDICRTSGRLLGASWNPDGTIVYSDFFSGIMYVSADGGYPETLVAEDWVDIMGNGFPIDPIMFPDGRTLLYTRIWDTTLNIAGIEVKSLGLDEPKRLGLGFGARYIDTGHLVYQRINNNLMSLWAVPFDLATLKVTGEEFLLTEDEDIFSIGGYNSRTMVYISRPSNVVLPDGATSAIRELGWVDRDGNWDTINVSEPKLYRAPKISPVDEKVVFANRSADGDMEIFVMKLTDPSPKRLITSSRNHNNPIWNPDGDRIFYDGRGGIYSKAANGIGEEETVYEGKYIYPFSWTADGDLVIMELVPQSIEMINLEEQDISLLIEDSALPQVSPDGKYLAYCSADESGIFHVYVRPFPNVNETIWEISLSEGGNSPLWSKDGKELFYLIGDFDAEGVMRVEVTNSTPNDWSNPELLFRGNYVGSLPYDSLPYDVHKDGRFLMIKESGIIGDESTLSSLRQIHVVTNWLEELKQGGPVD